MSWSIVQGDAATLTGPRTRVSRCVLDAAGEITTTVWRYTEYHSSSGSDGSVYVVGRIIPLSVDLLAVGVRDQVELTAAIAQARILEAEAEQIPEVVGEVGKPK